MAPLGKPNNKKGLDKENVQIRKSQSIPLIINERKKYCVRKEDYFLKIHNDLFQCAIPLLHAKVRVLHVNSST